MADDFDIEGIIDVILFIPKAIGSIFSFIGSAMGSAFNWLSKPAPPPTNADVLLGGGNRYGQNYNYGQGNTNNQGNGVLGWLSAPAAPATNADVLLNQRNGYGNSNYNTGYSPIVYTQPNQYQQQQGFRPNIQQQPYVVNQTPYQQQQGFRPNIQQQPQSYQQQQNQTNWGSNPSQQRPLMTAPHNAGGPQQQPRVPHPTSNASSNPVATMTFPKNSETERYNQQTPRR